MPFLIQIIISLFMMVLAVLLRPKPKEPKAPDMDSPTAEAGRPIPVVFGSVQLKDNNIIAFGLKKKVKRKARTDKK